MHLITFPRPLKAGSCRDAVRVESPVLMSRAFPEGRRSPSFISHLMRRLAGEVSFQRLMSFVFHSVAPYVFHTRPQCMTQDIKKGVNLHFLSTREGHGSELRHCSQYNTRVGFNTQILLWCFVFYKHYPTY